MDEFPLFWVKGLVLDCWIIATLFSLGIGNGLNLLNFQNCQLSPVLRATQDY